MRFFFFISVFSVFFLSSSVAYAGDIELVDKGEFFKSKGWSGKDFFKDEKIARTCQYIIDGNINDFAKMLDSINVNSQNEFGHTLLFISIHSNNDQFFKLLMEAGANSNIEFTKPLSDLSRMCGAVTHIVCEYRPTLFLHTFAFGGDVNLVKKGFPGYLPLLYVMRSMYSDKIAMAKMLLRLGANPNNESGPSLLNQSLMFEYRIAELLLDNGADPLHITDQDDRSFLQKLILIKRGTDPGSKHMKTIDKLILRCVQAGDSVSISEKELDSGLLKTEQGMLDMRKRIRSIKKK